MSVFMQKKKQSAVINSVPEESMQNMNQEILQNPIQDENGQLDMGVSRNIFARQENKVYSNTEYYSNRAILTEAQDRLEESLWREKDTSSMQAVKSAMRELRNFHSKLVTLKDFNASRQEYINLTAAFAEKCEEYISSHNPYTKSGKERLRKVKEIRALALADLVNFEKAVDHFNDNLRENPEYIEKLSRGETWENLFAMKAAAPISNTIDDSVKEDISITFDDFGAEEVVEEKEDISITFDNFGIDEVSYSFKFGEDDSEIFVQEEEQKKEEQEKDEFDVEIEEYVKKAEAAEKERAEREKAEKEKAEREKAEKEKAEKERAEREKAEKEKAEREKAEKEKERAEKEAAEREKAEKERAKQIELEQSLETEVSSEQILKVHMPDGNELHEKYRTQNEDLKFEGFSFYNQRAVLTEKQLLIRKNLEKLGDSRNTTELKQILDSLQEFHNSPVLTEKQRSQLNMDDPESLRKLGKFLGANKNEYLSLVNSLKYKLHIYITDHKTLTEKGKAWMNLLEETSKLLENDKKSFINEVENFAYNFAEELPLVKEILNGGKWRSLLSVSRSISGAKILTFSRSQGNGVSETTAKYKYRDKNYFRKTDVIINSQSTMNNVACHRIASMLGGGDIFASAIRVREYDVRTTYEGSNSNGVRSNEKYGVIMEAVKGMTFRELHKKAKSGLEFSDEAKKQIARMILIDFICGQTDRKDDNFMVDTEVQKRNGGDYYIIKSIKAIDSDQSLGFLADQLRFLGSKNENTEYYKGLLYSPDMRELRYVDKNLYNIITGMDVDAFIKATRYALLDCDSHEARLKDTFEFMKERILFLKNQLFPMLYKRFGDRMFELPENANDIMHKHDTMFSGGPNQSYVPKIDIENKMKFSNISYYLAEENKL